MEPLPAPRFETGRPLLMGGLRELHTFDAAPATIPAQWARFRSLGELPGQRGTTTYGITCQADWATRRLEYMCAYEVDDLAALPPELGRLRVPAATYAVFQHVGPVATLPATWARIWQEWYPASGRTAAATPDFEVYGPEYNPLTGLGGITIYFPVEAP